MWVTLETPRAEAQTSQTLQDLVEGLESQEAAEALAAELDYLRANPMDLNQASARELASLPWISDTAADSIVAYRRRHGPFRRVEDLQATALLDEATFRIVRPYLRVRRLASVQTGRVRLRGQRKASGPYRSLWSRLVKAELRLPNLVCVGAEVEGDAGERRLTDFVTGYAALFPRRDLTILLGDYTLRLGCGLLFGAPYAAVAAMNIRQLARLASRPVRGYTYTDESFSLRGGAVQWQRNGFRLTAFWSRRFQDGWVDSTSGRVNLVRTGYHRSVLEKSRWKAVLERVAGGDFHVSLGRRAAFGLTLARGNLLAEKLADEKRSVAVNGELGWAGARFFSETTWLYKTRPSWITGVRFSAPKLEAIFLAYNYAAGLTEAFRSNPFGARRTGRRQAGTLAGFQFGTLAAGFSALAEQKMLQGVPGPVQQFIIGGWWHPNPSVRLSFRFQTRGSESWRAVEDSLGREHTATERSRTTRLRLQLDLGRGKLVAQVRAAVARVGHWTSGEGPPQGRYLHEQIRWRPADLGEGILRWEVFDVRNSSVALYTYEPGLPGTFSVRRLSGSGWRTVLLVRFRFWNVRFSVKLANTGKLETGHVQEGCTEGWEVGLQLDAVLR